jgi:uncharacterized membrane-anchored protein YitT (DUF2179 family)
MSDHNDKEKQNITVKDNKAVIMRARIIKAIKIIMFFPWVYATVEIFSGRSNMFVRIIIFIVFLYQIVDPIIKWIKRKKHVVYDENKDEAQKYHIGEDSKRKHGGASTVKELFKMK